MSPIIHFKCTACEREMVIAPSRAERARCPHCNTEVDVFMNRSLLDSNVVTTCVSCGHDALYVQKDFNRQLGIGIVGSGIALSVYFFARSEPVLAMAALAVTALVDFCAYLMVGEVTVCYSCHAIHRGFKRNPEHQPFDLKKLERYGGRSPRRKG